MKFVTLSTLLAFSAVAVVVGYWPESEVVKAAGETSETIQSSRLQAFPTTQSQTAAPKLEGCITCHDRIEPMHKYGPTEVYEALKNGKDAVGLSCTNCHGGNPVPRNTNTPPNRSARKEQPTYNHGSPKNGAERKYTGANPNEPHLSWARECRVCTVHKSRRSPLAAQTLRNSGCHALDSKKIRTQQMAHGAMLWGAALYNNGGFPLKDARFGESYSETGAPQRLIKLPNHQRRSTRKGLLDFSIASALGNLSTGKCAARI